jgi:FKBP-type peptidyl-prolyl cis-trans isomerase
MSFFGAEVTSEDITWIDASLDAPIQLSHACLVKPGLKRNARILIQMRNPENYRQDIANQQAPGSNLQAPVVGVLSASRYGDDNMNLDLLLCGRMGVQLFGDDTAGAVVHLVGLRHRASEDESNCDEEHIEGLTQEKLELLRQMGYGDEIDEMMNGMDEDYDSDDDEDVCVTGRQVQKRTAELRESEQNARDHAGKNDDDNEAENDDDNDNDYDDDDDDYDDDDDFDDDDDDDDDDDGDRYMLADHGKVNEIDKEESSARKPSLKQTQKGRANEEDTDKAVVPKKSTNIITHFSGLKFQELLTGSGKRTTKGKHVAIHYTLRLESGKVVDKSGKNALKFRLGTREVIPGMDIGVSGMREGGERHLIVPPNLGYGNDGAPPAIPRDATLFFDVKLVRAW